MKRREMTMEEIRQAGIRALVRELGPAGAVRFLQFFDNGHGDYSRERHQWLPDDLATIEKELKKLRKAN